MEIMTVVWPKSVDGLKFQMLAHIASQTYRYDYWRLPKHREKYGTPEILGEDGKPDRRAELVEALRIFATYIEHSARMTDDEVLKMKTPQPLSRHEAVCKCGHRAQADNMVAVLNAMFCPECGERLKWMDWEKETPKK